MIVNETLAYLKHSKREACFFKIDFEKAYDSVNWVFLDDILGQMGFPNIWRKWINGCLSSGRSSVLINGSPTSEFDVSRGLRQGDPLSPFLFIISMEAFHVAITTACNIGVFRGIALPNGGPILSHLLFADDAIIMGEASISNMNNLARILRCFTLSSGLKVSFKKSKLFGIGIDIGTSLQLARSLHCQNGSFPFTYLGVPVGLNMSLIKNWKPAIDKVAKRLSKWKEKSLSFGGRTVLAKAVLGSIPLYFLSMFRAPATVIKSIEQIRRKFVWGENSSHKKISWVSWRQMMAAKDKGGMGIGSLHAANIALLLKWLWRLKSEKTSLWGRVIKSIHHSSRKPISFPCKNSIIGPWKNIVKVVEDLNHIEINVMKLIRCKIGNGSDTLFWIDNWTGLGPLKDAFPILFNNEINKFCAVCDRIVSTPNLFSIAWEWCVPTSSLSMVHLIRQCAAAIPLVSISENSDSWGWDDGVMVDFTVNSARRLIESRSLPAEASHFKWSNWVPLKVSAFAWRASLGRIPSNEGLFSRGVPIDLLCPMCASHSESVDHLLVRCCHASRVWENVFQWCKAPKELVISVSDILLIHNGWPISRAQKDLLHAIFLCSLWCIWKARNDKTFNNRLMKVDEIMGDIKVLSHLWINNIGKFLVMDWDSWCNFSF